MPSTTVHDFVAAAALVTLLAPALASAAPEPGAAPELTAEETLGRQIFFDGEGEAGREITAVLGDAGAEVPASALPCASCHGEDGRGRPEGGLFPSDVTWPSLTKPYGAQRPSGRKHPPYSAYLVKRAVTMGLDAGGNPLHVGMPRYQLTHGEAAALVAYLKRLGDDPDPGVSETGVRIGVVLPPAGTAPGLGRAIRAALEAAATRLDEAGGIYGRRLELKFLEPPVGPEARLHAVESFLAEEDLFALAASFIAGADAEVAGLVARDEVPLVGPFSIYPESGFPINRYVFYLVSGLPEQARALVRFAARELGADARRAIVVFPDQTPFERVAEAIGKEGADLGRAPWNTIVAIGYPPGGLDAESLARAESSAATDAVLFLGSAPEAVALFQAASAHAWAPRWFLLGPLAGGAVPALPGSVADRVFFSFATLPTDTSPRAYAGYRALAEDHRLPADHVASQLAALAAFDLLVEALERTGRDLRRQGLIASLEGIYRYPSAYTPELTFGPNRRIGALGAYVVAPDLERRSFSPSGEWIGLR